MNRSRNRNQFEKHFKNHMISTNSNDDNLTQESPSPGNDFFLNRNNYKPIQIKNSCGDYWKKNYITAAGSINGTVKRKETERIVKQLEIVTSELCKNNIDLALEMIENLKTRLEKKRNNLDGQVNTSTIDTSKDSEIVNNVRDFLNLPSNMSKGRRNNHLNTILRGVWCSISGGNLTSRFLVKRLLSNNSLCGSSYSDQGLKDRKLVENSGNGKNFFWSPIKHQKERGDKLFDIAKKYIYLWQHDENVSVFESNSNAIFKVSNPLSGLNEEHRKRLYIDKGGLKAQYSNFSKSDFFKSFVNEVMNDEHKQKYYVNKQPSIGLETFRQCLCKCVGNPTTESCVDVHQDKEFLSGIAM